MLSICMQSWQQYVFGYERVCPNMCVCVCMCVYMNGREGGLKVPRQNNEGKWIPDGLFFLFSLCCQWREESDKPLMGNRLTHSGFELGRHHRAAALSLCPPWDSTALFLTTIALRKSSSVWGPHITRSSYKSWQNNMTLSSRLVLLEAVQLLQQRNNSPLFALSELWVWDQQTLVLLVTLTTSLDLIIYTCHHKETAQFDLKRLHCTDGPHEQSGEINPSRSPSISNFKINWDVGYNWLWMYNMIVWSMCFF